ncbi:BON domain-containing protein [Achromobacter ruhlandii]|uniref:BON domain-containing protein n=1 Tax=Achromobacter ruhlandii TaxID=72557 RepID=A0ABM8LZ65_9BURK|nr:BON domain-containing protein [Achromobacter ruhlandii]AOU93363.1 osmotically inducible protein Y [Achromobacter ruhlandii]MCZ8435268.1 BON domain-containing protein [Achromobacter ruhlandii]MDC6091028.1 BON domain-containing protein [Achromobacter ruhlandii]MDC6149960.1 BON domain-containing protein [Achromobacter ruhlandii]MDD7981290.1 BON domain-containing protein [Achromobacter ruhlandii]
MKDEELRRHVLEALEFDPSVDATGIGVAAFEGVVTLTGHVGTYSEKYAAEKIVAKVKGVKGIAQDIEVRASYEHGNSDEELARRALHSIAWNVAVPDNQVQVKVQHGWITLGGAVRWRFQRDAAESSVRQLKGVKGVVNQITLDDGPRISDVKERIERALKRSASLEAHDIEVNVRGHTVILNGRVKSWLDRRAAEKAAWNAPSVTAVEDNLIVS